MDKCKWRPGGIFNELNNKKNAKIFKGKVQ